jgi:hypothetical protein
VFGSSSRKSGKGNPDPKSVAEIPLSPFMNSPFTSKKQSLEEITKSLYDSCILNENADLKPSEDNYTNSAMSIALLGSFTSRKSETLAESITNITQMKNTDPASGSNVGSPTKKSHQGHHHHHHKDKNIFHAFSDPANFDDLRQMIKFNPINEFKRSNFAETITNLEQKFIHKSKIYQTGFDQTHQKLKDWLNIGCLTTYNLTNLREQQKSLEISQINKNQRKQSGH